MIRPPPLKLKYDNRFPPPMPSARRTKDKETFFAKLYKANWRNLVIAVAGLNALRYAFAAVNAYEDAEVDNFEHAPKLATISIALGVIYAIACVIEIYGVISASLQRMAYIRAYIFLAFIASVLATVASVLNAASFFLNAEDLMYECVALSIAGQSYAKSQFRGRPWPGSVFAIGIRQAQKQCIAAWTQESWTQVINVFLFGFLPALMYYLVAYTYYRQTTDPSHAAYLVSNRPSNRRSNDASRTAEPHPMVGYARLADTDAPYAGTPRGDTNNHRTVAPPAANASNSRSARLRTGKNTKLSKVTSRGVHGTSTSTVTAALTTRSLKRSHRPPALVEPEAPVFSPIRGLPIQSDSPLGYMLTPGPPTFGVGGPGRVGIGSYGPGVSFGCSAGSGSAKYDKFV